MQKQKLLVIIGLTALLIFGGLLYKKSNNKIVSTNESTETKDVFTSIKDALSKNVTLVCDFKDETGTSTKSYIKNGAVRVSSSGEATQAGEIIIKDKKMYMWDIKTKQGFVYDVPDQDVSSTEVNQSENYLNMIDKYKDSCKMATVEDSYFETPSDVTFQDMSKLLEDLKNQVPQTGIPIQ